MKTKWTKEMIAESNKSKQAGIDKATKRFKVTPNAVFVKYGRIKRNEVAIKPTTNKVEEKTLKVKKNTVLANTNVFKIEQNTPLIRRRSRLTNLNVLALAQVAKQLEVNKDQSICIPKTIAKTSAEASNLVLQLRRMAAEDKAFPKDFAITMRTEKNIEGQYTNTRIWRIA